MGSTLSQIRSLPEGPTPAQLPFFPEDGVDDLHLPPRPSSVCHACWEGPFAMHFGLPCMSPGDGRWYQRWPEEISYSITLEQMESRADSGCVWCLLLLPASREVYYDPGATGSPSLNITVRGTAEKWRGWGQKYQRLDVEINGDRAFQGLVYTTAGAPKHIQAQFTELTSILKRWSCCIPYYNTNPHPRRRISSCSSLCKTAHRRVYSRARVLQRIGRIP